LVVAFEGHIASTAVATVCASPATSSATPSTLGTSNPGSTQTRDDPQSGKPIGYAVYIRARPLVLQDSFRFCPS
jgi:hypothetical protein